MRSVIRKAFVLGAGLGTRLQPLTEKRPKPLIPVCGKPLITFAFDHLVRLGVEEFVVNTHHRPESYVRFFPGSRYREHPVVFRHEPVLLETAGGIKNVQDLIGDDRFIVYNGDILTDLPVDRAVEHHVASGNLATLVLRSDGGPLHVALDSASGLVVDILNRLGTGRTGEFLFTGVYILESRFFDCIPEGEKLSVTPLFLGLISKGERIGGIVLDEGTWQDLGTRDQYLAAHRVIARENNSFPNLRTGKWPVWLDPTAEVDPTAELSGSCCIGRNARIGGGVRLKDTVVWDDAVIRPESNLENCVITDSVIVSGSHSNEDL